MLNNKKIVTDKSALFALVEATEHFVKVSPESDEYLKVWVKEPTWLETEKAMNSVMKIDQRTQTLDIDLQAMYRYMIENFIEKTEPSLSTIDMLRISPYVGNQLKEILPNPMSMMQEDEEKKRMIRDTLKGKESNPKLISLITVYSLSKALGISPLEVYKMPTSLVKDLLSVHMQVELIKSEEMDKLQKNRRGKFVPDDITEVVNSLDGLTKATLRSGIEFKGFTKTITSVAASTEGAGKSWTTFSRLVSGTPLWAFQNKMRAYLSIIAGFETRSKENSKRALEEQKTLVDSVRGYEKLSIQFNKLEDAQTLATASTKKLVDIISDASKIGKQEDERRKSAMRIAEKMDGVLKDMAKTQGQINKLTREGASQKLIDHEKAILQNQKEKNKSMGRTVELLEHISEETLEAMKNTAVYQKVLLATGDENLAMRRAQRLFKAKKGILDKEHQLRVRDAKKAYALDEERITIAIERAKKLAKANKVGKIGQALAGRKAKKGMKKQMAGEMEEVANEELNDALTGIGENLVGSMKNILPIIGPITKGFAIIKLGFKALNMRGMTASKFRLKVLNLMQHLGPLFKMAMMYFIYALLFIIAAAVIFTYLKKFSKVLEELGLIDEIKQLGLDAFEIAKTMYKAITSFIGGDYTAMLDYLSIALDKGIAFALKAGEVLLKVAWLAIVTAFDLLVDFFVKLKEDKDFREKVGDIILKIGLFLVAVLVVQMLLGAALAALSFLALPALIVVGIAALLIVLWARFAEPITVMAIKFKDKVDIVLGYVEKGIDLWVRMFKFIYMGGAIKALKKALKPKNPFKKAMGGTSHGGMTLVGEQGPELVNLPAGAQVKTNNQTNKMMGGTTVNNYITINAKDTSKAEMRRIANELGNMINMKVNRSGSSRTMR